MCKGDATQHDSHRWWEAVGPQSQKPEAYPEYGQCPCVRCPNGVRHAVTQAEVLLIDPSSMAAYNTYSSIAAGCGAMSKKGRCTHSPLFDSDPLAVGIHLAYKVIASDSSNYNWC